MQRCKKCNGSAQQGTAYLNGDAYCERDFRVVERRARAQATLTAPQLLTAADLEILVFAPPQFSAALLFRRRSKAA
jgi:hypothetical protein